MNKIVKTLIALGTVLILGINIYSFIDAKAYDPGFKNQWYLDNDETGVDINAKKMWKMLKKKTSQEEVVVAVIDTGVYYTYDELVDTQWINSDEVASNGIDDDNNGFIDDIYGWSFVDNKPFDTSMVESNHGTMCAGIIAARHNGKGIEGVTKNRNIKIMSVKVLSSEQSIGEGTVKHVVEGISYAEKNGADICNLSFSTEKNSTELYNAIKFSKMLFVVSAGNNNSMLRINIDKKKSYPGSYMLDNLITVANMTDEGKLAKGSNYGKKTVDVIAPGSRIYCISDNQTYGYVSGTSFSAPIVTGIAANILSIDNSASSERVKKIICDTVNLTDDLYDKCSSGGYVNGAKAIEQCMKGD
ncbi:MAG: S8 family peptidase [Bacillota bacterium]|nr:S8 family peptidase [Bacillota bacterium]